MPGRVVEHQERTWAIKVKTAIGFVKKGLEDVGVDMTELAKKGLTRARADDAHDTQTQVLAVLCYSALGADFDPAPTRSWIAFDPGLVAKPKLDAWIREKL